MLSSHVRDADEKKRELQRELADATARSRDASADLSAFDVSHANAAVAETYALERAIESETQRLLAETAEASRRATRFRERATELGTALKELGDLAHWTKTLEEAAAETAALASSVAAEQPVTNGTGN